MIVVTTPTGQIGSQVVPHLLAGNEAVRVNARRPDMLAWEVRAKREIVKGSTDDEGLLISALEGAESPSLVVPPSFTTSDAKKYDLQFTRPSAAPSKVRGRRQDAPLLFTLLT